MNQELIDRCPFREKTASRRLYMAIARSEEPMTKAEVARAAHLTAAKTATLLAAYVNPMHRAPLDRVGVRLVRTKEGGFTLQACKPKPNAKRPPRGMPKKEAKKAVRRAASDGGNEGKTPRKKRTMPASNHVDAPVEPSPMVPEVAPPSEPGN
jgi:branched-subunit amino acid aminotransferase/4-amino-4-deoxychorismate lyase